MLKVHNTLRRGTARVSVALLPVLLACLAVATCAHAVSTSFWRVDSFEALERGTLHGTSVLHDGRVVLAPAVTALEVPECQYVWAGGRRPDGSVVLAAGTPGVVYAIDDDGAVELLGDETSDFPALVVSPSGDVYVGTAPGGDVFRIRPDGSSELFFETGETYVWSLAWSPVHGLLVGTGDAARVYAVDGGGSGRTIYDSEESSISSLAVVHGAVFAGTGVGGLLVDVTPGRDLRVLYDTPYDEITAIAGTVDGVIYFAAASVSLEDIVDEGPFGAGFGEGAVYRTTPSGGATELWTSEYDPVTSLGSAADGRVLAGIGSEGLVYSVGADGTVDMVAELDGEEVLFIGEGRDALVAVGLPGGLFTFGPGPAESGEYESDALDTRSSSAWGELAWRSDESSGDVELFVRSGNTSDPGETWSDWFEVDGSSGGSMDCPDARYLQWKARLTAGRGSGPSLLGVEAAYLTENLPPVIGAVTVHDPGDVVSGAAGGMENSAVKQSLPSGIDVTYSLEAGPPGSRDLPVLVRGLRTASWEAVDPNGDALTFEVFVRAEDEDDWRSMETDILHRTLHTWDTLTMADGVYRVKVVASDRPSNSERTSFEDAGVSAPFRVDHTVPTIRELTVSLDGGGVLVKGTAEDADSPVMFVDVSVDYAGWEPAFAEDGMFDSRSESFRLLIEDLSPGEHTVAVRAVDRAGNPVVARKLSR